MIGQQKVEEAVKIIHKKAYEDLILNVWKELDEKLKLQTEEFNNRLKELEPTLKEFIKEETMEQLNDKKN